MTQFIISLSIVLVTVMAVMPWPEVMTWVHRVYRLAWESLETVLIEFYRLVWTIPSQWVGKTYMSYTSTGRHRRDNPPDDSEVDRWAGADIDFASLLHLLNQEIKIKARV